MRGGRALALAAALATAACGSSGSSSPTAPTTQTMSGVWVGSVSDSSGSMMGAGFGGSPTWTITQTGNTFVGTMQLAGHMGGQMTVTGTMQGHTGTFTITMPAGSMMNGQCSATATGTFDMDDMMTQFHGTYSGTNSCTGPFDRGTMSMHR